MSSSLNQADASQQQNPQFQDVKLFAAVGYLGFLCFVPLYYKKGNKFARFHGKQALVLFILELAAGVISIVPAVGDLISRFAFVVFGLLSLIGILKVLMEEYWEMPVIYEISTRINI